MSARGRVLARWANLVNERSSWLDHWRELGEQLAPRRPRFLQADRNRGQKKNSNIVNNTPLRAVRTLSSGMMSGITSPARPWFRLAAPGFVRTPAVLGWLQEVQRRMEETFARSNLYNALPLVYGDLGTFGTTAMIIEEDEEDVIRAYVLPIGQYCLASSHRLAVDTIYREISMTVEQTVRRFGKSRVSRHVREAFEHGRYDEWVDLVHVVEPRWQDEEELPDQDEMDVLPKVENPPASEAEPTGQDMGPDMTPERESADMPRARPQMQGKVYAPTEMPWRSLWIEKNADESDGVLYEGGFNEWPVMCPRWEITGEDVYGSSPGMNALGDAKALQLYEKRKAQAIDKIVNPPMKAPSSLRNQRASLLPGDVTYLDTLGPGTTFEPAMVISPQAVQFLDLSVKEHEARINAAFYADLWLAITNDDRNIPATAREIVERHEEKMLQLGPTLERIQDELLDPMIERVFNVMVRRGLLPPPPQELRGTEIKVEYLSVMSKAQKLVGTAAVERLLQLSLNMSKVMPDIVDKLDADKIITDYAEMVGVDPTLLRTQQAVDQIRQQRAAAQQQQQAAENAPGVAAATKDLGDTKLDQDSALQRLMASIGAAPVPGMSQ
jgi:hypothetical protein